MYGAPPPRDMVRRYFIMATAPGPATSNQGENIPLGIGLMVLGMFLFSVNDALGKWLVATYAVTQLLLVRSAAALAVITPVLGRRGIVELGRMPRPVLQAVRIFVATAETACFYFAVTVLPLADAFTYYLAGPIYVTVLAVIFLKEKVGWRRWAAVLVGFIGVVIALQPGAGAFGWYALIAFVGSLFYAVLMIMTRVLRGMSPTVMATSQMWGGLLFGVLAAPVDWVPIASVKDGLLLALVGVVAVVAIVCVNRSLRLAPASAVVPYQYTLIVWAVVFGYFVFDNLPSVPTMVGALLIVGSGLFIFFREQKVAKVEPDVVTGP
ncbi:EamA domain-containing membrane protein RarD [Bauldia litoralis]|uniref:EamA domain-containing membrane protein RarD n=2 Tax=Bauldia litoralis TaxID=665467 RepID=A0A1G6A948_9HYPH|nr:EamA domain-containing membrane protein RarD [Bauldia litoralis]